MPPRTKKKHVQTDSEESDSPSDSDSNSSGNGRKRKDTTVKKKPGRPPSTNRKRQQLLDSSDDDDVPTQQTVNGHSSPSAQSGNDTDSGASDATVAQPTITANKNTKKQRGRPPVNKKQKRQTRSDMSPQPSTSQQPDRPPSDEESGSESADSDFGPMNERSFAKGSKKKKPNARNSTGMRQMPNRAARSPKQQLSKSMNGLSIRSSQGLDASFDVTLINALAHKLVYFLLIEEHKKYPIRRKAIVTNVLKDDYSPKVYTAVIKKANNVLKMRYGIELLELENVKDSYLLVNILRKDLRIHDYLEWSRLRNMQHGLIMFLLTIIFMNENVITEDELTKSLRALGIDLTTKRLHPVFGDVKRYITVELVKQLYLTYECISKDPPRYEFSWGVRAKQEFDKMDLLQYVCQIVDDTAPEDWRIQFKDAVASAQASARQNVNS